MEPFYEDEKNINLNEAAPIIARKVAQKAVPSIGSALWRGATIPFRHMGKTAVAGTAGYGTEVARRVENMNAKDAVEAKVNELRANAGDMTEEEIQSEIEKIKAEHPNSRPILGNLRIAGDASIGAFNWGREKTNRLIDTSAELTQKAGGALDAYTNYRNQEPTSWLPSFRRGGDGDDTSGENETNQQPQEPTQRLRDRITPIHKAIAAGAAVAGGVGGGIALNRKMRETRWVTTQCRMAGSSSEKQACETFLFRNKIKEYMQQLNRCKHSNDPVNCKETIQQKIRDLQEEYQNKMEQLK